MQCPKCRHFYQDWFRALVNLDLDAFHDEYPDPRSSATCLRCQHKVNLGVLVAEGVQDRPATVNRELHTLKSILSTAVEWGVLVESPAGHIKRLRIDNRRTRILSMDEQRRLLQACQWTLRAIVTMALCAGGRVGELLNLRWDQCDQRKIVFLNTKNGKERRLP